MPEKVKAWDQGSEVYMSLYSTEAVGDTAAGETSQNDNAEVSLPQEALVPELATGVGVPKATATVEVPALVEPYVRNSSVEAPAPSPTTTKP